MEIEAIHCSGCNDIAQALQGGPDQRCSTVALINTLHGVGQCKALFGHPLTQCSHLTRHGWGLGLMVGWGIHVKRDTIQCQGLNATSCVRCRDRGKTSIWDNTVSKRSGNVRLKKRDAGVVPSEARQSKLCRTVHTL